MNSTLVKRLFATAMCAAVFAQPLLLTSCKNKDKDKGKPADYGTYGADIAREIASQYPDRAAYSEGESQTGAYIEGKIKELGFTPEIQTFQKEGDGKTEAKSSANYIVKIPGTGFYCAQDGGGYEIEHRVAIIGTHYDAAILPEYKPKTDAKKDSKDSKTKETDAPKYVFDGISDNASGTACVLTALKAFKEYKDVGYDVWFVFFGAGTDNHNGAEEFCKALSKEEFYSIDVMYNIDSLYSGDKVYASSGFKSLQKNRKYEMRRKLYQTYDVCFTNTLYTNYGFDLYYNEACIKGLDIDDDGYKDVFSEVPIAISDYKAFDDRFIPIVYFESFDYNYTSMEKMRETKNLTLQDFDGTVRGTPADCTAFLDSILVEEDKDRDGDGEIDCTGDRLQIRINCVAFIVCEALLKGSDKGMTPAEYEAFKIESTRQTFYSETTKATETSASSETSDTSDSLDTSETSESSESSESSATATTKKASN